MSEIIKAGIIGQGRSGKDIHARTFGLLPEKFKISAVAERLEDRREEAKRDFGCDAFPDLASMLSARPDLDLIVNAATSEQHIPLTEQCLDAGFKVVSDKPFGRRVADVDRLIAKAKAKGVFLAVFQQSRFAPYFQEARKVCESGVLGRIVQVKIFFNGFARRWDWQTLRKRDGGNLLNTGPHPLDQALHFIGRDAMPEVLCVMDKLNSFGDAEDHVKLILTRKGRPTIDLEVSSCSNFNPYTYQIYGSRGSLAGTMTHLDWKYFKDEEAPAQSLLDGPMPKRAFCSEALTWHEGSWEAPEEVKRNLFDYMATRYYSRLHDSLTKGAELAVKLEEVRQQIAVIEEAHRQNGSYQD